MALVVAGRRSERRESVRLYHEDLLGIGPLERRIERYEITVDLGHDVMARLLALTDGQEHARLQPRGGVDLDLDGAGGRATPEAPPRWLRPGEPRRDQPRMREEDGVRLGVDGARRGDPAPREG